LSFGELTVACSAPSGSTVTFVEGAWGLPAQPRM
jgi:hypothetical protein